ncbi:tyrosine-protein phosphatase non-receptor type 11-like [Heteronotia binoei]|uniref:tyrosine-protein phosphatase non-receptor type 11-like n=1 Tax=Heteronotia binoei TaxID=13085 RepID=UPI00292DD956|nr:tyrosine-protein phosphatase non-receptor type 11-like [Heteronotia binoei]
MVSWWYNGHLTGKEAEGLLTSKGKPGIFLVWESQSKTGDFTLSIRRNDKVTHIKIQNMGNYYDLYGEKFATLPELVQYYTEQQPLLREKNSNIIELKYPLKCQNPALEMRYNGRLKGKEAEQLLTSKGKPGSFLVWESQSKWGDFPLSIRRNNEVTHIKIQNMGNYYDLYDEKFATLPELVQYYTEQQPLLREKNSNITELKYPLSCQNPAFERWYNGYLTGKEAEGHLKS